MTAVQVEKQSVEISDGHCEGSFEKGIIISRGSMRVKDFIVQFADFQDNRLRELTVSHEDQQVIVIQDISFNSIVKVMKIDVQLNDNLLAHLKGGQSLKESAIVMIEEPDEILTKLMQDYQDEEVIVSDSKSLDRNQFRALKQIIDPNWFKCFQQQQ